MERSAMFDKALELLMGDMDQMEGKSAMAHDADDCPDPLGCDMHEDEHGDNLSTLGKDEPATIKIEVGKGGMPSLDGAKEEGPAEEGLSDDDREELKRLLSK